MRSVSLPFVLRPLFEETCEYWQHVDHFMTILPSAAAFVTSEDIRRNDELLLARVSYQERHRINMKTPGPSALTYQVNHGPL